MWGFIKEWRVDSLGYRIEFVEGVVGEDVVKVVGRFF